MSLEHLIALAISDLAAHEDTGDLAEMRWLGGELWRHAARLRAAGAEDAAEAIEGLCARIEDTETDGEYVIAESAAELARGRLALIEALEAMAGAA